MREEMRTFGYLCPKCGKTVMKARSVFALEASGAEVECDCGGSALTAVFDGERYQLTVPCGLCGGTHTAVCSREQVLEGAVALACAETKQFCCFIGPEGTVEKQLRELAILAEKEQKQGENYSPQFHLNLSTSPSHTAACASLGIRQSPRGDRDTVPIFGPSGRQFRLNCWEKKRR